MHVMHQSMKWEDYLPLVEFSYNNGYQASLKMSPFEVLYGRSCNTLVSWSNPINRISFGPDMLKEMEQQVTQIKQNLKVAQNRQKSYADQKRTPREFKMGDHIYLRVLVVEPDYLPDAEVLFFQPCLYPMKYLHPRSMYTLPHGGVPPLRGPGGLGASGPPAGVQGRSPRSENCLIKVYCNFIVNLDRSL
jgi:hypothetical protein